jgi:hypothetical protein
MCWVEPKIRAPEDQLKRFLTRRETVGDSGCEAEEMERDMARQARFVSDEFHDFADRPRRAADPHL